MPERVALSQIRGEDIAAAQRSLPPCDRDSPAVITADVDAQHIGRVRIAFTKGSSKHHRTHRWFWVVESAERIEHVCDRKGPSAKVVDESGAQPITGIYPTCSVCGTPRVFQSI